MPNQSPGDIMPRRRPPVHFCRLCQERIGSRWPATLSAVAASCGRWV